MGLAEKRAVQSAESSWLPKRNQELEELSGGEVHYEINWATFAGDPKSIEWLEHNGPQQVAMALRVIGRDAIGKEAIQQTVKKVVIEHVTDPDERDVDCTDGVLCVRGVFSMGVKGTVRDTQIRECLEAVL